MGNLNGRGIEPPSVRTPNVSVWPISALVVATIAGNANNKSA